MQSAGTWSAMGMARHVAVVGRHRHRRSPSRSSSEGDDAKMGRAEKEGNRRRRNGGRSRSRSQERCEESGSDSSSGSSSSVVDDAALQAPAKLTLQASQPLSCAGPSSYSSTSGAPQVSSSSIGPSCGQEAGARAIAFGQVTAASSILQPQQHAESVADFYASLTARLHDAPTTSAQAEAELSETAANDTATRMVSRS